jgi:hypothetical protein
MFHRLMHHSLLSLLFLIVVNIPLNAQIAVGQWRDHLPYQNGRMVADAGSLIYYAGEDGLFSFNKADGDVQRLSKVEGMSDVGYSAIAYNSKNNALVVAYKNTNIDLIKDNSIINVPDIRERQILGNKTINNIHIDGDFAYLACGFGIVVVDLARNEIKETYIIGPGGTATNVYDVSSSPTELFACTEGGVLRVAKTGVNLLDFANWERFEDIPAGKYNAGTYFNGRLYVNLTDTPRDTLYFRLNDQWFYVDTTYTDRLQNLESTDDRLLVIRTGSTFEYNTSLERLKLVFEYVSGQYALPNHATHDGRDLWIADRVHGLIRFGEDFAVSNIRVNGPSSTRSYNISVWDGRCYVASGGFTVMLSNQYDPNGYFTFKDNEWKNVSVYAFPQTSEFRDYVRVLTDPFDSRRVYAATWGWGLVEYYDDQFVKRYDTTNSAIRPVAGTTDRLMVAGLAMDRNRTLWASGAESGELLYAKAADGTWYGFGFDVIGNITMGDIVIDDIGQKWVVLPRGAGLLVFNDNGTLANTTDDQAKRLNSSIGNGNLASTTTTCLVTDLNGQVWVGTDNGISVFFSPQSVFSGNNFDSQRILVQQDGYVQYLLENEMVTTIQVDGANRKWIGTEGAGVFLMSPDGTEEILRFTMDNSPLFSNNITSIGIDQLSGEVFIGTDKGMISYRGTATYGEPEFMDDKVYAFPNPVRHDYLGPIAIKGLVRDADVKITDAAGRTVFATKAEGGQAIWDGRSFGGNRAKSGVYMVFASDEEGNETFVTKVLLIQ